MRHDERGFFKVTVDRPKAPFTRDLLTYRLRQAGLSKAQFYAILRNL